MNNSVSNMPLLVWDVDDVLNQLMECWLRDYAPERFRGRPYPELTENPPCRVWGFSREEYQGSLDRCRREELYQHAPRPEISEFFQKHGHCFRHAVLSAVPLEFMEHSARWVLHWFGDWIQNTMFIPSFRENRVQKSACFRNKTEALRLWGRDALLIDDSPNHVSDVLKNGGKALLFPAPWNENRGVSIDDFLQKITEMKVK